MGNKKVKNATVVSYNGVTFKSKLEASCYKLLEASGLHFTYEPERVCLWKGENITNVSVYERVRKSKELIPRRDSFKLRNMTYTPDFKVEHKDYTIYFDAKGHATDMYMLKKKMFIQQLNDNGGKYMFFEPRNQRHMKQAIEIIKKL